MGIPNQGLYQNQLRLDIETSIHKLCIITSNEDEIIHIQFQDKYKG